MNLQTNPFFLLRVSSEAGRQDIIAAAEERSFFFESIKCIDAQNALLSPDRRLCAELDWFLDADRGSVASIWGSIESGERITVDGASALSKLNAALYNFQLTVEKDPYKLGYMILTVDKQYSEVNSYEVTDLINARRRKAKFPIVQEYQVSVALNKKRDGIRQILSEKLAGLDEDSFIKLVTLLAQCIASEKYDDGVILSDIVDIYEIRMQTVLEKSEEEVRTCIETVKQMSSEQEVTSQVAALNESIQKWDKFAQPLQLKSKTIGIPHENSVNLGKDLLKLVLNLDAKGNVHQALALVEAMKELFGEIRSVHDVIQQCWELLRKEIELQQIDAELQALKRESKSLIAFDYEKNVDRYIGRIRRLNTWLKARNLDAVSILSNRKELFRMARVAALELHHEKKKTQYALNIIEALASEFSDIPDIAEKLKSDAMMMLCKV